MALVLAIGLVPQFFSMRHMLGLECSSWLFYSHVESLGLDSWGLVGHFSLHASLGFLPVWQSGSRISYLVAGIPQSKSRNSQVF